MTSSTINIDSAIFDDLMEMLQATTDEETWNSVRAITVRIDSTDLAKYSDRYPVLASMKYTSGREKFDIKDIPSIITCRRMTRFIYSTGEISLTDTLNGVLLLASDSDVVRYCFVALAGALSDTSLRLSNSTIESFHIVHDLLMSGEKKNKDLWDFFVKSATSLYRPLLNNRLLIDTNVILSWLKKGDIPLYESTLGSLDIDILEALVRAVLLENTSPLVDECVYSLLLSRPDCYRQIRIQSRYAHTLRTNLVNRAIQRKDYTAIMCAISPTEVRLSLNTENTKIIQGTILGKWEKGEVDEPIVNASRLLSSYISSNERVVVKVALDLLRKLPKDINVEGWNTEIAIQYCENILR